MRHSETDQAGQWLDLVLIRRLRYYITAWHRFIVATTRKYHGFTQSDGVRVQRSSGTTRRTEAMRFLARAMEEERQRQEHGFQKVRVGQLCKEYRRQHLPVLKPRTQAVYEGHIATLNACFGDRYIDELRKADLATFVARQKASGLKPPTVRRYLATLSSMLTFAARCGWLDLNPMMGFDKRSVPEPPPRSRFLSQQEFRQLHDAAKPHLRPLLVFAVNTGMRLEELLSLKWDQVDLDRREVRLTVTKSNRPRVVPLSDSAVAAIVAISRSVRAGSSSQMRRLVIASRLSNGHSRLLAAMLAFETFASTICGILLPRGLSKAAWISIASAEFWGTRPSR